VFDKESAQARAALAAVSDQEMLKGGSCSPVSGIFTMPRVACIRGMVMNHLIHTAPSSASTSACWISPSRALRPQRRRKGNAAATVAN